METLTRNTVPQEIEEVANKVVSIAQDSQFLETECHPSTIDDACTLLFNKASSILLQRWLEGSELKFTMDEVEYILKETVIDVSLRHMASLGILDSVEDESGELVFWIKDEYKGMTPDEIKMKLDDSF